MERSVSRYSGALEELQRRWSEWFGKISSKGTLSTLLLTAENSSDQTHVFSVNYGAGDRGRTGDVQLGKLTFYH